MTAQHLSTGVGDEPDEEADEDEAPETVSGRLLALYEQYLGEPDRKLDVYVGFGLFFGGIALAAVGLVVFLWSSTLEPGGAYWSLRQVAIVLAISGLPSFMLSVVVLLPVDRRIVGVATAGTLFCLAAVAVFVWSYPSNWNVARPKDYSALGVTLYGAGLAILAGGSGSALVAYHLQTAQAASASTADPDGTDADAEETVSDAEVRGDIDEALSGADLSWGGVEKTETKRLKLDTADIDGDIERSNLDSVGATVTRSADGGVDDAVSGLQQMQGQSEGTEARGSGTEDTVSALNEFREREGAELETGTDDESLLDRLRAFLSRRLP